MLVVELLRKNTIFKIQQSGMKFQHLLLLFIGLTLLKSEVCAQIFDDFSDGDFTSNPTWTGSESFFTVENEMLRSNSPGAATYFLSTPNSMIDETRWSFFIRLAFATSGSNYVDVFLMADNPDLSQVQNGYFLRFGGTPDEISFYKVESGTVTQLIDGEDGVVGSSSNNVFDMIVDRSASGEWHIEYDSGQTGNYISAGSVTDAAVNTTGNFGFRIVQSSAASPVNGHYFDNVSVGPIPVDNTPPLVVYATGLSSTQVQLVFSEPVETASAEDLNNYSITQVFSSIISASQSLSDPAVVILNLDVPLPNGAQALLTVNNVQDLSGNTMSQQSIGFTYFVPDVAAYKDVVFNEIMADPSPAQGLPEAEFVELFNASDTSIFDLENWKFVNTTTVKTLPSKTLFPGDYLLLCDINNVEQFSSFGNVVGISSFTALANSGDSLTLINPEGVVIDIVSYSDSWYQDAVKKDGGWSLELINPFTVCSGPSNWAASANTAGGTPGSQNSIFDETPDTTPPTIIAWSVISPNMIRLEFNETMDNASLLGGSYAWSEGISTEAILPANDLQSVRLGLATPLETGVQYTLMVSDVADCNGNVIEGNTTLTILLGEEPGPGDLLITEIMADPSPSVGLPEGEYFELYNASDKVLDVAGTRLNDKVLSTSRILNPGEYLLCIDASLANTFLVYPDAYLIEGLGTIYFTNGGRELNLYNPEGERMDRVNYTLDWYRDRKKSDGGYSLERMNLQEPCRGGDNWMASVDPKGGTPGAQNSVYTEVPDSTAPAVSAVYATDSLHVQIFFTEIIDSMSVITADFNFDPQLPVTGINNIAPQYTGVAVELGAPMEKGIIYNVMISGIRDCMGNEILPETTAAFGLPEKAEPGDLLINEILFNPRTGGSDYLELVNVSGKIIGIQYWELLNRDQTSKVITEKPVVIFPGNYVVFTDNPANIASEYPFGNPEKFLKMDALPSFPNASGAAIIQDDAGIVIDRFDYQESYHFSLLTSFKGVALERINFNKSTQDPGNWTSAASTVDYGTPGVINSEYHSEGQADGLFELENEVFSPDNDGFEDILIINYRMEAPGYSGTMRIFDSHGRLVKMLMNNELLPVEGSATWDGVLDNGVKARIGPYILFIEVFNLDGNVKTVKLPLIVAGRLSN